MLTVVSHKAPQCLFTLGCSISCQIQGLQSKKRYLCCKGQGALREEEVGTSVIFSWSLESWGEGSSIVIVLESDFLRVTFDPLNYSPMLMKVRISCFLKNFHFYLAVLEIEPRGLVVTRQVLYHGATSTATAQKCLLYTRKSTICLISYQPSRDANFEKQMNLESAVTDIMMMIHYSWAYTNLILRGYFYPGDKACRHPAGV